MAIEISGQHLEITPAIKDRVNNRLEKLYAHTPGITSTHIMLISDIHKKKDGHFIVEAKSHIKNHEAFASASHMDMYKAIDDCIAKLDKQLIKMREKDKDHRR